MIEVTSTAGTTVIVLSPRSEAEGEAGRRMARAPRVGAGRAGRDRYRAAGPRGGAGDSTVTRGAAGRVADATGFAGDPPAPLSLVGIGLVFDTRYRRADIWPVMRTPMKPSGPRPAGSISFSISAIFVSRFPSSSDDLN